MQIADDNEVDMATRVRCLRIVGSGPPAPTSVLEAVRSYLATGHDSQLQLAAIDTLADQNDPQLATTLIETWRTHTPALRAHVLDLLLARKQSVSALLAAIEARTIQASEIDAAYRSRLTSYPDDKLRDKAAACFSQGGSTERAAVVAKYEPLLKKGDVAQGRAVFQKNCAACHKVHDIGNQVGPDIAARQDKSNVGLLREILDPNRAVDQRYAEYIAVTNEGIVNNGVLVEETGNAITLRGQEGKQTTLLRSQLESLTFSGKSLMPEGVEKQITPDEMSDLLEFLASP